MIYFTPSSSPTYYKSFSSSPKEVRLSPEELVDVSQKKIFEPEVGIINPGFEKTKKRCDYYVDFTSAFEKFVFEKEVLTLKTGTLLSIFSISGRIGSPSKYGEAYEAMLITENIFFSFKAVPLPATVPIFEASTEAGKEKELLKFLTQLVLDGVCPHLPIFLGSVVCYNFVYQGTRLQTQEVKKARDMLKQTDPTDPKLNALLIFNELANNDLNIWLPNKTISQWKNMIFQIVVGLFCSQKFFGFIHKDLHPGNILVHLLKESTGWWVYIIDLPNKGKTTFTLPNCGFVATLWDFGLSTCKKEVFEIHAKPMAVYSKKENSLTLVDLLDLLGKLIPLISLDQNLFSVYEEDV